MIPADAAQGLVVHGLGIDADAPDPQPLQGFQLAPGDGIWPSRLHGVLPGIGEQLHHPVHQAGEIRLCQRGRRSAAHVHRPQPLLRLTEQLFRLFQLPQERVQIGRDQLALAHGLAGEGAVRATRPAKGNRNIQVGFLRAGFGQRPLHLHDLPEQRYLFRQHVEDPLHPGAGLVHGQAVCQPFVDQPGGADTRQRSPRGPLSRQPLEQLVQRDLAQPLDKPLFDQLLPLRLHRGQQQRLFLPLPACGKAAPAFHARAFESVPNEQRRLPFDRLRVHRKSVDMIKQLHDLAKLVGQPFQRRLENDLPRVLHACSSRSRPATVASPWPGHAVIWGVR